MIKYLISALKINKKSENIDLIGRKLKREALFKVIQILNVNDVLNTVNTIYYEHYVLGCDVVIEPMGIPEFYNRVFFAGLYKILDNNIRIYHIDIIEAPSKEVLSAIHKGLEMSSLFKQCHQALDRNQRIALKSLSVACNNEGM